jgi:8-oxo-dGTP pyrophosphatase MutT (NUDIX family)
MPHIDEVRAALARHHAVTRSAPSRAAVALLLRPDGVGLSELLLIERARKEGDPWSGHMAFPGGRQDPEDPSPRATAERETLEEVGIDLAGAELLGQLDDLEGRHAGRPAGLAISAFVYCVPSPPLLVPNEDEVESAFWVPLAELQARERHVDYRFRHELGALTMPGIRVSEAEPHVVWGLTYRFLEHFFELLGRPLRAGAEVELAGAERDRSRGA